jgi:hypothetical protein
MLTDVMQLHQLDARCGQACNITKPRVQDCHVIRLRDDTCERVFDKLCRARYCVGVLSSQRQTKFLLPAPVYRMVCYVVTQSTCE